MTTRHDQLHDLDSALRRALQPRARQAPMPHDLLRVPGAWVRSRRSATRFERGLALITTAAVATVLVTALLTRIASVPPAGGPVDDPAAALAAFGVDPQLGVRTEDGVLALRVGLDGGARIRLGLITGSDGEYAWRDLATAVAATDRVAQTYVYAHPVSCVPDAGLTQPDIVFGYIRVADDRELVAVRPMSGLDVVRGRWNSASGGWHAGLFLYALQPGQSVPTDGLGLLIAERYEIERADAPSNPVLVEMRDEVRIGSTEFGHDDACTGEMVGGGSRRLNLPTVH